MIWNWLKKLFKKRPTGGVRPVSWPTREQIALLPWFDGLGLSDIEVIDTPEGARRAEAELAQAVVVGFDTESKPTFVKGAPSHGPHVVQFSTLKRAYVFMLHQPDCRRVASELIALSTLKKVGFGLSHDLKHIHSKLHVSPQDVLDLETLFSAKGYGRGVGVKVGVALIFKRRFRKSSRASTSNWGARHLTDQQILYAANDAFAAIKVYDAFLNRKK